MTDVLPERGIQAVPSYEVYFPGREYSADQVQELLREHGIESVLIVRVERTGVSGVRDEGDTSPTVNVIVEDQEPTVLEPATLQIEKSPKPWADFSVSLYDTDAGLVVWTATASTSGNAYAGAKTLLRSLAKKVVEQLALDEVIPD